MWVAERRRTLPLHRVDGRTMPKSETTPLGPWLGSGFGATQMIDVKAPFVAVRLRATCSDDL